MEVEPAAAAPPWEEALDLDGSDPPSLLRPCKRHRSTTTTNLPPQPPQPPQPPPSTSRHRTIPGPAGAVQSAMLRKNLDQERITREFRDNNNCNSNEVISTQDYIRRAMEDTAEFDEDFARHPWLSALQFLGAEDGVIPSTPISSIKKGLDTGKVDQVVAVIKTCTPNGLGGLIVMLKDPTGTVGASIHHKVLCESEFGKNITIGAVLILQKVAVFAPVKSAQYLNITLRNLVKVFSQDSGSTSNQNSSARPIQYADPVIVDASPEKDHHGKAKTLEKTSTDQNVTMEHTEKERAEYSQNLSAAARREQIINLSQDACNKLPDNREFANGSDKGGHSEGILLLDKTNNMTDSVEKSTVEEIGRTNEEVEMQRQEEEPLTLKTSVPEWTDEQLNQLFDEDDSFFG